MARRRNTNARRSGGQSRRRLFWARRNGLISFPEGNLGSQQDLLSTFQAAYDADLFGFTVTRVVGHYTWWVSEAQAVSTTFNLSVGIRIDEQVDTTGITDERQQNRLPANDPFADWMYVRNNLGVAGGTTSENAPYRNTVELDLRSQRRLDELGQSLFLFAGHAGSYAGSDTHFWYDLNILCKRP